MIPARFAYDRPTSLDEALNLLSRHEGAKLLAGGQSLLPLLKLRVASADRLIDIGRLSELKGVRHREEGGVEVGALTTYRQLAAETRLDWAREAIDNIGDVQVRNRGTVGGAIAHADPASDLPALALVLDYRVVLRSRRGERIVPLDEFLVGPFETVIEPDEVLVAIRRGPLPQGVGGAYMNLEQPASGYSIVGVAAVVGRAHRVAGSTTFDHIRVAITGVGPVAYRARAVEDALVGTTCGQTEIADAAKHATDGVTVNSDIHADREYRTAMAEVYVRRALEAARARAS
ncbi:MAG TPA: xanthine dehydrogenase family protein subunit M [Candidatus Limnocylindrales bacterium]|jgi:carbon-monoxide dehydrogenase medium subunit|nr:xanthine dehydrogenase family protein subunit M [Candidatus Limnocylindrales bacterium]